jgi:excisionase family DNA binding protein
LYSSGLAEQVEKNTEALTVPEVAKLCRTSTMTIYRQVKQGCIPHFKIGDSVRFDPKSLAGWLRQKITPAA